MIVNVVNAHSDLGVHIDGSRQAPYRLKEIENLADNIYKVEKALVKKEKEKENKEKNFRPLNAFNEELYKTILSINDFVITVGGDHSISIASALASKKKNGNIGLIWIDSHSDFHNFKTTISGNIHGMPFATISGQNGKRLSYFFDGEYFDPQNTVLVGGRDIEPPEYINLKKAGTNIFTTEDIKKNGVKKIMEEAIKIATQNTDGIHVSFDIDVIDPQLAPGVSIKAKDGININEAKEILEELLKKKKKIKSFDLVEYNPVEDIDNKTYEITSYLLEKMIKSMKK